MKFHFGLGKFFTTFDKSHRDVMRMSIEAGFGIHYCLDYPGSGQFFKKMTSARERSSVKAITRVPCFNIDVLHSEVDLTLKTLGLEQIDTLQLWGGDEVFDIFNTDSVLYRELLILKKEGKINNFLPQLYYDQTIKLNDIVQANTPFVFYGSPVGLHVNKNILESKDLKHSIAMSIFGGVDKLVKPIFDNDDELEYWNQIKEKYSWTEICLMNLKNFEWIEKVVGTTGSKKHMEEIVSYFLNQPKIENADLLNKISIQSCSQEHMAVQNAEKRWLENNKRLRSKKVYIKSLAYHYIKKNNAIHNVIDKLTGRG